MIYNFALASLFFFTYDKLFQKSEKIHTNQYRVLLTPSLKEAYLWLPGDNRMARGPRPLLFLLYGPRMA